MFFIIFKSLTFIIWNRKWRCRSTRWCGWWWEGARWYSPRTGNSYWVRLPSWFFFHFLPLTFRIHNVYLLHCYFVFPHKDRFLPIANVARIMKKSIPKTGKVCNHFWQIFRTLLRPVIFNNYFLNCSFHSRLQKMPKSVSRSVFLNLSAS